MLAAWTPTYGPATLIETRTVRPPEAGPGEVLVDVTASTVSAGDIRLRTADFPGALGFIGRLMFGWSAPRKNVQGTMFAGQVVEVGAGVTRFAPGDAVFGMVDDGAWAEQVVVKADGPVSHRPPNTTSAEAAALPYGANTALHFLRDLAKVQPGERVLVLGGSGGVGRFAIQLARHLGAHVTAVGSARSFSMMQELGADVVLDYKETHFAETGARWDVIFDVAEATDFGEARTALTAGGRFLTLYMSLRVLAQMLWTSVRRGQRALFAIAMPSQADMDELAELLGKGVLTPVLSDRFPLERIADAHHHAEHNRNASVVVEVARPRATREIA